MTWWQNGIIYQIYPRSFADSNGDGIGDLNGITARLDYLADLGVDAIWLSPIYPSPDVDFGYDISDYCAIDPKFGTLADFDQLVSAARARNIHVILDLVLNHTSNQHPWFIESCSSRDNPKRDWYLWRDPAPGLLKNGSPQPPNNWASTFGGSGWEFNQRTGQFYFHMFYKQQPDLNWRNPQVRQAMLDVFRFWLERGVDGFRLDVFNVYYKHPQFANNPSTSGLPFFSFSRQQHINDCDQPDMFPLMHDIRALLAEYSTQGRECYVVGETFLSDAKKAAQYCGPDKLHAAFNFELIHRQDIFNTPWSAKTLMNAIQHWEYCLGDDTWPNYVLNNHDVPRSATRWSPRSFLWPFADPENDARMKQAATLLLTLRGTPFMYYGEEIGMRDIPIRSKEDVLDPIGKTFWPVMKGRDGCRAPMQWSAGPNAGFTRPDVCTWLPIHEDHVTRNVDAQRADPRSLFNLYRQLIALRRATPALTEGMFMPLTHDTRYLLSFLRQTKDQVVLVALNFSRRRMRLVLGSHLAHAGWRVRLSTHRPASDEPVRLVRGALLPLEPQEAVILEMIT